MEESGAGKGTGSCPNACLLPLDRGVELKLKLKIEAIPGLFETDPESVKIVARIILGPSLSSPLGARHDRQKCSNDLTALVRSGRRGKGPKLSPFTRAFAMAGVTAAMKAGDDQEGIGLDEEKECVGKFLRAPDGES
jgi:hypothetical protein